MFTLLMRRCEKHCQTMWPPKSSIAYSSFGYLVSGHPDGHLSLLEGLQPSSNRSLQQLPAHRLQRCSEHLVLLVVSCWVVYPHLGKSSKSLCSWFTHTLPLDIPASSPVGPSNMAFTWGGFGRPVRKLNINGIALNRDLSLWHHSFRPPPLGKRQPSKNSLQIFLDELQYRPELTQEIHDTSQAWCR